LNRILLVDDDKDNLDKFSEVLLREGFEVDSYLEPIDALAEFKPGSYDLVILDYFLRGTNGVEVYDQIRTVDKTVHAILLTGSNDLSFDVNKELTVIKKPIYPSKLIWTITVILNPSKIVN
jgi:DNA-binding response OmpR family regulator